jgi:hypothetical protein
MGEWDYDLIFSGPPSGWMELADHLSLAAGQYIFDLKGHTVIVNVKKPITKGTKLKGAVGDIFAPNSEAKNFNRGKEFALPINYIWKHR